MTENQKQIMDKAAELSDLLEAEYKKASKETEKPPVTMAGIFLISCADNKTKEITSICNIGGPEGLLQKVLRDSDPQAKAILLEGVRPHSAAELAFDLLTKLKN